MWKSKKNWVAIETIEHSRKTDKNCAPININKKTARGNQGWNDA
jgi:uncharacterized protein YjcR